MKYKTTAQSELTRLESAWPPWCSLLASKAPFGATHDLPVARCFCSNLRSERWKNNFVILERENKTHILSFVALFFFSNQNCGYVPVDYLPESLVSQH